MSYSRNFGFRSFENIVRDARFKAPADAGTPDLLWIGEGIVVNQAAPGFVARAGAGEVVSPGCGIAVFEHITNAGLGGYNGIDMQLTSPQDVPFSSVPASRYVQSVHGIGVKVWHKNTATKVLYDGRSQTGRTPVAGLGATPTLIVGDYLTPDGSGGWKEASGGDGKWLWVEHINSNGTVECRLTF